MRFIGFVALFVVTLVACCFSVAIAENVSASSSKDNHGRRFNPKKIAESATHFLSGQVDDQMLKKAAKLLNTANGDEAAIKKALDLAALAKATAKASDDEVAKITAMVKEARRDEARAMRFILGFARKKTTDESTGLLSKKIADTVNKSPSSWDRLKKFALVTLGTTADGFAIYGAYKLLMDKNYQTGATTTG
ncbi:hypothetical protein PPTG_03291 [Phytophthora nicotianae INRA-310]|uniref:RxLR effector protein n=1 Tax=Phytophthora nicotianae (strain INRA-310) TaxID=761204 RepID=W2R4S3_PHYN3|nr:hypothetical protein PPTG_03291 [Phytophthora nicotianae INRA-310]ETN20251.1 hypothetical protein PPTG_03291 [Phytophthora nicotianae INRA-310]